MVMVAMAAEVMLNKLKIGLRPGRLAVSNLSALATLGVEQLTIYRQIGLLKIRDELRQKC